MVRILYVVQKKCLNFRDNMTGTVPLQLLSFIGGRFIQNRYVELVEFKEDIVEQGAPFVFFFVRDGGKFERFAFRFERGKNLSEFIKLNLFVFFRDGGKCERFAFRFVPKKSKRNWRTLLQIHCQTCTVKFPPQHPKQNYRNTNGKLRIHFHISFSPSCSH